MQQMKEMPYVIGLKIRLYPDNRQKNIIAVNDGASRSVYNHLAARHKELFMLRKVKCFVKPVADRIDYLLSLGEKSSELKAAYPYLEDRRVDAQAVANAIKNYHAAWNNFRKVPGTSIPKFHKKGYAKQYQTNAHYKQDAEVITDGNVYLTDRRHIMLPKLKSVRFKASDRIYHIFERTCETRIGTIKISMDECGRYYASLQIGSVDPFHRKLISTGKAIGVDVNIENFCTDSDGVVTENPRFRKRTQEKLAKAQRKLSRMAVRAKKEGRSLRDSRNYQKQRIRTAELHRHAAAQREAFQNNLSKAMVENQDMIFVENLTVKNMVKNHALSAAISDCAWSAITRKLEYKAGLYGRIFAKVRAAGTTQTCSACGYEMKGAQKLDLSDREWTCPQCGTHHIRDYNAAVNIKKRGLAMLQHA
jgi:putative transposase